MNSAPHLVPRALATAGGKVRVLIVDDSVVIRHLVRQALQEDANLSVVGSASNGLEALEQIPLVKPDVVTLDIEMPQMDGLEALRQIRKRHPKLRTIMFSTLTTRGASATFEALSLGADDYVAKVSNAGALDKSLANLRAELIPKIRQFFTPPRETARTPLATVRPPSRARTFRPRVLAVGVSTGGPQALAYLIPKLPASFPLPVLIVQHMPPMFTRLLAERLQSASSLQVVEAADGMPLTPGRVLVAPGDFHLRIRRNGPDFVAALDQGPQENSCRPAVDALFRSLAETHGSSVLPVVLTGMGSDGLRGVEQLKAAGAYAIVQDEASSVVWGMPGAVAKAGLADRVLPLDQIAPELIRLCA